MNSTSSNSSSDDYYVVSMGKFTLLYLATHGLFGLYWFYKNWSLEQGRTQQRLFPLLRTVFAPVFVLNLFQRIFRREQEKGQQYNWNPQFLGVFYVAIFFVDMVIGSSISNGKLSPKWMLLNFPLILSHYYIFYKVQLVCNRISNDPYGKQTTVINSTNVLWIIFGFFLWFVNLQMLYAAFTGNYPVSTSPQ